MSNTRLILAQYEQGRTELLPVYRALPALEQTILQLFSVIFMPVSRTDFMACLNKTAARDDNGKAFIATTLKPHVDKLLDLGLLSQLKGEHPRCHQAIAEVLTRETLRNGRFGEFVEIVHTHLPLTVRSFRNDTELMRELRISLYSGDLEGFNAHWHNYRLPANRYPLSWADVCQLVCNNPFDTEWLSRLPDLFYQEILTELVLNGPMDSTPAADALEALEPLALREDADAQLRHIVAEQFCLQGRFAEAESLANNLPEKDKAYAVPIRAQLAFMQGDYAQAAAGFENALKYLRKAKNKRKLYFNGHVGLLFIIALLHEKDAQSLAKAAEYTAIPAGDPKHFYHDIHQILRLLVQVQQGDVQAKEQLLKTRLPENATVWGTLIAALAVYWTDPDAAKSFAKPLKNFVEPARDNGYHWLDMQLSALIAELPGGKAYAKEAAAWHEQLGGTLLVDFIIPTEAWELALSALESFVPEEEGSGGKPASELRLAWFIHCGDDNCRLQPREQRISVKNGKWSKGRNVALKRLRESPGELPYLTKQDLRVATHIEVHEYGYYGNTQYEFERDAITALIGHPLVFWDGTDTRVEIVEGQPELRVTKGRAGKLSLQLVPAFKPERSFLITKETPTRLKIIRFNASQRRLAEILGSTKLHVPVTVEDRVRKALGAVSGQVTVHSDIGGGAEGAQEVEAQLIPHFHLQPAGEGLKVAQFSKPFAEGGPYYRPGEGGRTVIAEVAGKRLQTTRDLTEEKRRARRVIDACPTLQRTPEDNGEWLLEEPEDCLEALFELQSLENLAVVEWPEGEKFRITHRADASQFSLSIKRDKDWFAASGELRPDEDLVLDMQQLLTLLDKTSSRFIPLKDGQFLALTREFRKRLDELRAYSEKHAKGLRFNPLLAPLMQEWSAEVGKVNADKAWREHLRRLQEAQDLQPVVPTTLQAELRDYQAEGFRWLARLAHWGVGACLADDMGLGKTVQALGVLLTRAPDGPALVIAPTSVGMNWHNEARKFAPTLNTHQFGSGNRQQMLDDLGPFDVLVCSYGLLQQEDVAEMLSQKTWQTIVLDEAQAIKNMSTKRSQAAMNLQSEFKIITTGTPVENHLGELWNLFRFLNPGLLGSLESFNQRFAVPIEKYSDKTARQHLRKLIQPFILRRTKSQVLEELPERTEITLQVELSREELAFYEALRQQAVAKLADSDAPAGRKHLQILAEIMRLRRACCNTRLVDKQVSLPSAKLTAFGEILTELLDNRHKALVFSQFTDHLAILRDYLEGENITYQYLDGSTPAKQRQQRVDAFQAGEGEVFLISLKAGGTGLNLTAADYVIHMDPWWNPAVEDQASDRAHRIGQQRPVTIYRLVAKDTIEEQIVDLHAHKRDLADSLLEGADMSGRVSADELLALIRG